ncbi:TetR/AcrR family transcriptional regulator [Streptomyces sp. SID8352]|uniref:TetR/AcrR family transcriptional regulator n=1 Tax=Streptomyces sp. SID8352 TaxID=2690338 RepID=UPI00136A1E6E|nr:TetR/AcrR family transcriptional regulator [Streptomyces sp. SID8352]MYU20899.1 TetR family transcriptional regulator [Streptomyces sp. SID8352]
MQTRAERTRRSLVRAAAELIADGSPADAGLVNVCRRAGVSRGALYHHYSSLGELTAEVYGQARGRLVELMDEAFAGPAADAPERFLVALGGALRAETVVRAGVRLAADGSAGPPLLRDELPALVRERVSRARWEGGPPEPGTADLVLAVAAGIESLGYTDPRWWDRTTLQRLSGLLRPLVAPVEEGRC